MAINIKSQIALEKIRKKYGLGGTSNNGKQSNSASSNKSSSFVDAAKKAADSGKKIQSTASTTTAKGETSKTKTQTELEGVRKKYGLTGTTTSNASSRVPAYGMTKAEYDMRRSSNSSMPEYGSYEYYKQREATLRPIMEEIANDFDRQDPTYKAWVENYEAGRMPDNTNEYVKEKVINLSKKFKYQDSIIAEYEDVNNQLLKYDRSGIHYDGNGNIDTKSGAEEAKYAKERYQNILRADPLTNLEMGQGLRGELPEDKQKEYNKKESMAKAGLIESAKEDAYNYYEKNQNNVYEDNFWGRLTGNYKIGRTGIKSNQAGYTSFAASSDDIEASEVYQALSNRIQNRNIATFKNNGATDEVISIIGQYLPQGLDQIVVGTAGRAIGSLVGSGNAGKATATAYYMYEQTAGAAYVKLLQESDLSVEDAKKLAANEALASAAIEFGLDYAAGKLWSNAGKSKVIKNMPVNSNKLTKLLMDIGVSEKGAKTILNVAKNTGKLIIHSMGEGVEEGWQEGVSITAEKYAKEGETASPFKLLLKSWELSQYSKEELSRMGESFMGGAIIGFGQGGVEALSSYGINKLNSFLGSNATTEPTIGNADTPTQTITPVPISQPTSLDPIEQAAREVVAERTRNNPALAVETMSINGETITPEDAKKASGYGKHGSELLADAVNKAEGRSFSEVKGDMHEAYTAGLTNRGNVYSGFQEIAYEAGQKDKLLKEIDDRKNASNIVVNKESGFSTENLPNDVTETQVEILDTIAKTLGVKAYMTSGLKGNAEYDRTTGEVPIDVSFERKSGKKDVSIVFHGAHEMAVHAVVDRSGEVGREFVREMYKFLAEDEMSDFSLAEQKRNAYARQGVELTYEKAMEEVVATDFLTLYGNNEARLKRAIERIANGTNTKAKQGLQMFIDLLNKIILEIQMLIEGKTTSEKAKMRAELNEVIRLRDMFESAYGTAAENVQTAKAKSTETDARRNSYETKSEPKVETKHKPDVSEQKSSDTKTKPEYPSVKVGDVYVSNGNTYTITKRENGRTTYTVTRKNGGTSTKEVSNVVADINFTKEDAYQKISDVQLSLKDSEGNTLTEAQQEYFKDSKVRDENGNLLVVYHGTTEDFTVFERGDIGYHFGTKDQAEDRVNFVAMMRESDRKKVMPAYLNVKNPYVFEYDNGNWNGDFVAKRMLAAIEFEGDDAATAELNEIAKLYDVSKEATQKSNELLRNFFEKRGYDGIKYLNENEGDTLDYSYIAFRKNQIKDINNTTPTSNPDINYSLKEDTDNLSPEDKKVVDALGKGAKTVTNKNGDMVIATNKDKNVVMYSLKTYEAGGKEKLEQALRANGHTEAEIAETLSYVDDAADYLKILAAGYAKTHNYTALSNHLIADVITNVKTGKQVISAIVNNGDYPVNIDLALICKKRVAYMNLMNRLIDDGVFDKVNYGGEAIAKVNDLLRADGFETACLGCFVESRRLQFQTWAETIVSEWNEEVDKRTKNASNFNFADGKAKLTDAEMDALAEELKNAGKKNAQGNLNLGQGSVQTRMGRLLDKVPSLRKHLTVADLLKPDGLTALRAYDSNLFSIVKSRYGAASPKIVQDYNPYASEIAMMTFSSVKNITSNAVKGADAYRRKVINEMGGRPVKQKGETAQAFKERKAEFNTKVEDEAIRRYLYDIGGARIQSFSDFMIENVFDYIQIFADLSAKRLPLHGYTKEIVALRLFGMTGAKWNGSLIAHVDRTMGKEYAGLLPASEAKDGNAILVHTEDGDYAIGFDDYARYKATNKKTFIQSIGMKDIVALQLDPRYSSNVGSITIGVSDKQILAMLDSPLFRFVIPYHSSGMLPQFAKLVGVDLYNDYTDYQNTTVKQWYDAYGNPCNPISDVDVDTSYNFNAEVQKTGDARKAAANYLKWCDNKHPVYGKGKKLVGYVTFNPKFSNSPYGTDFSKHENYYKLLEDFNVYDNITEESAVQGAVTMNFPSEQNRLSASEMDDYKARLRDTGIFSEKEIEKYSAIADKTFKELIADEVKGRAEYQQAQAPKWENTVKNVEQMLLGDHARTSFSLKGTNNISSKDQKQLLDTIKQLKGQFEVTKFAKADPKKLAKMTRDILKEYDSKADTDETRKAIDELYQYIANGEGQNPAAWNDVYNRAYKIAQNIVENALVTDDYMYQEYKSLRDYLRNTPLKFNAGYDSVPTAYENFNDFRKQNFGRLKFANEGMSIDSFYHELSDLYPEFFDSEEHTNAADQLERIVDVLDEIQPTDVNPFDGQVQQASMHLANDLINRFFDIPQAKPTFADKAERRVINTRIKAKKQLDKVREQRDIKIEKEKAKRRDSLAKMSEKKKASVLRARIMRHTGELHKTLTKATDQKHIPPELENAVLSLLYNINLESNYTYDVNTDSYKKNNKGYPTNKTKAFLALKEVYAEIAKNNDYGLTLASELIDTTNEGVSNIFDEVMKLSDKKIADMTSEELTKIYDAIRIVEHSIVTANKMFAMQKWEGLSETAKAFEKSVEKRRAKHALMKSHLTLDIETPITFFSHFGEAGNEFYQALRNAQDKEQGMIDELAKRVQKIVSLEQVQKAEKELFEFTTTEGKKLTLSKAHIMDIYLLYNRKQGKKHLLYDPESEHFGNGIHQPEIKSKHIRRDSESTRLTKADLDNIISKLSDEDKAIADKLQKTTLKLAEWGNKACLDVFGYEKFNDPNYWTIKSAKESINQTPEKNKDIARSIKNMGSAKSVEDKATNALDIGGVFNVFNQHASDMICYSAWLGAMEDATKLYNYTFRDENGYKTNRTFVSMLEKYAGEGGSKYYFNLMKDIQNGIGLAPDTATERIYTKLFGMAAKAKVAYKATVVAQQPTAMVRAAAVLNPLSIMQATVKGGANLPAWAVAKVTKDKINASEWYGGWKRALKYSPIAARKAIGGYEINANDSGLKGVLYKPETKKGKAVEAVKESPLWAAGKADEITWGILWNACEIETNQNKSLEKGSEEYYEAVSELFNKVINETQVVDGVLQRSQLMRSSSGWIKPLTTFKGEPTMALNGVMRAYDNLRYEADPAKRGKAIKKFARATTVFLASAVFTAFARSLAVGGTGEDDEEYWKKVWKSFSGIQGDEDTWFDFVKNIGLKSDAVNNINPLTWLPITSELMSAMQGYDVERLDVASVTDFYNVAKKFIDSLDKEGKQTVGYSARQLLLKASEFTGYSPYNLIRDIEGAIRTVRVETNDVKGLYEMEKWRTRPASNVSKYVDILYRAYSIDSEDYEYIYNDMIKSGVDAETIENGMEERMKKAEGVEKASELKKRYMSPDVEKKYDNSLSKVRTSDIWEKANATQRKEAEADLYSFLTSDSEDMEKAREEAMLNGVDATEYTLWQIAIEMADQPKGEEGSGSYSAKEKAAAINSLNLGEKEMAYFYGKGLNESAKDELNQVISDGIDIQDYINFKAATSDMTADKNANGKSIPNSKKRKVVNYLNSANLTDEEWNYFYYEIMNYKK